MNPEKLPALRLKKGEDRRLKQGHLWIYSNEVDIQATPLKVFTPGQSVTVENHLGHPLGSAYVNPHSLISARFYSRGAHRQFDRDLLRRRLEQALALRELLYREPFYRLCFAEGDFLPGLVVDRFADYFCVQITTAGMETSKDLIIQVLIEMFKPRGIVLRNDVSLREMEGLPLYVEVVHGDIPEQVLVKENGAEFFTSLLTGQKTGWFYDHRENRARMQTYVQGKRVLDVFSYLGAWGITAARTGASQVLCVDSSQTALDKITQHAQHNQVSDRCAVSKGDAFAVLAQLLADKQKFDVVILDPPAFVKRRKDLAQGLHAYQSINQLALQLLDNNGILISASCSQHVDGPTLLGAIRTAVKPLPLRLQVIGQGHQAADHPIHPAMPETEYLKTFYCRIVSE
jgi:23S rRNA (cytosine1962-C5)-methyltransferase